MMVLPRSFSHCLSFVFFLIHRFLMRPVLLSSRHLNETRKQGIFVRVLVVVRVYFVVLWVDGWCVWPPEAKVVDAPFMAKMQQHPPPHTRTYACATAAAESRSWLPRRFIQTTIVIHLPSRPVPAEVVVATSPATKQHTHTHTHIQREQLLFYFLFLFEIQAPQRPSTVWKFFFFFFFLNSRNE